MRGDIIRPVTAKHAARPVGREMALCGSSLNVPRKASRASLRFCIAQSVSIDKKKTVIEIDL